MADTTSGTTATQASTPAFNFAQVGTLLHGAAFRRQNTINLTQEQYHAYCSAREAVEHAERCLKHTHAGLSLLLDMLDSADVEQYLSDAMRGLLGPLALHLEHHSEALAATIAE